MKSLVEVKNVSVEIDWRTILEDINLDIYENEIVAIIGLNWAGKTTLLKTIVGIRKPTKWNIILNVDNLWYVPQKLDFDKTIPISVFEFLKIYSNANKDQIYEKLGSLDSLDLVDKKIGWLSWGQLQKVLIVNALLQNSKVILMDEPTAWIDLLWEKYFYDTIEKVYNNFHVSVVLVSHDIHTVFSKASRVICLNKTICCSGKPLHLMNNDIIKSIYWNYLAPYTHSHDK